MDKSFSRWSYVGIHFSLLLKQPDYLIFVEGVEVGAAWNWVSNTSGNEYISLQLAAPEFGPRKLYANLGVAAGQDDPDTFAIIWNPTD